MRATRVVVGTLLAVLVILAVVVPHVSAAGGYEDRPGVIIGVDTRTGDEQWRTIVGKERGAALPQWQSSVTDGVVFVSQRRCLDYEQRHPTNEIRLVALDAKTGTKLWARDDVRLAHLSYLQSFDVRTSTVVENRDGDLMGVRARTGEVLWTKRAAETTWQARSGSEGFARSSGVVTQVDGIVLATDLANPESSEYYVTRNPRFEGWDAATGEVVWRRDIGPDWEVTDFTTVEGTELFLIGWQDPTPDGSAIVKQLLSIDLTDGSLRTVATFSAIDVDRSALLAATSNSIVVNVARGTSRPGPLGTLVAVDRQNGIVSWNRNGTLEGPAITDKVFVKHDASKFDEPVLAIDARSGMTAWPLPVHLYANAASGPGLAIVSPRDDASTLDPVVEHRALDVDTGEQRWSIADHELAYTGTSRGVAVFATGCLLTSQR